LLPQYLRFIQGVVDSEDLPLNVSRESIQSSAVMTQIKKVVTNRVLDSLKNLAKDKPEEYIKMWEIYRGFIKEGVATDNEDYDTLLPLLRFHTLSKQDQWSSLEDYVGSLKEEQKKIYYIIGESISSVIYSPHLEAFKKLGYDVLLMTDPMDAFMLLRLNKYKDYEVVNVSTESVKPNEPSMPEEDKKETAQADNQKVIDLFTKQLGEQVSSVRTTDRLVESPARLVDAEGAMPQEMQRVYHYLNKEYEVPKKILEINPDHAIIKKLAALSAEDVLAVDIVNQIYENALLMEGLHPNPSSMVQRIQKLIDAALK